MKKKVKGSIKMPAKVPAKAPAKAKSVEPRSNSGGEEPCNICGGTTFRPAPNGRLSTTKMPPVCVGCGSLERQRIFRALFDQFRSPEFKKLSCLSFGRDRSIAGGWFSKTRYSVKGEPDMLDVQRIALPDSSFDVVVCNYVLDKIPRYQDALRELIRVSSARGFVFVSFPNPHFRTKTIEWPAPNPKAHGSYRIFGSDIESRLPLLMPSAKFLRVTGKDPVTQTEDRAYVISKSYEALDAVTERGINSRFLRHNS